MVQQLKKGMVCGEGSFIIDPTDEKNLLNIMNQFGDSEMPFDGKNDNGEDVQVSVSKNSITVRTFQKNGWIRLNTYGFHDGHFVSEETFDGR